MKGISNMENGTSSSDLPNQNTTNTEEEKSNFDTGSVSTPSADTTPQPIPITVVQQSSDPPTAAEPQPTSDTVTPPVTPEAVTPPAAVSPPVEVPADQQVPVASDPTIVSQTPPSVNIDPQPILQEQPVDPVPTTPKKKRPLAAIIALAIVVVVLIAAGSFFLVNRSNTPPKSTGDIKVGLMMAFSGGSSAMGYGTSKGVALAKKQLGANNITVIEADSKCDPKAAVTAINQLIKQHVVAIIGDGCSSASLAALPIANNAQIPMVSPSASSTKLSIANDYFSRVIPNDNHQGAFMAQTVYNRGIRNVAVFYTNEPYGASIEDAFQNTFESLGGKVVATAFSQPNVIDLSSQIATLKAANPQAIFFAPNSVVTGIAAVKLARQAGITVPLFGADVFYDHTIISNAAADVEGMVFTTFPTGTPAFKQAIAAAYPNDSQLYAAPEAYDAFKAIYLAIQRGATTGQEIKNILPTIKFQGASANISFDQYGDLATTDNNYQYALFQVENGQFVQLN
jgi:branched-chain amino acid transport system substrate-binding protein